MEISELHELDEIDKNIGTPSAQKILKFLVCWNELSVKQLIDMSKLSESQVHVTLQNLIDIDVVIKEKRGVYRLSDSPFVESIKIAYGNLIKKVIGKFIHNLTKNLENMDIEEISKKLEYMLSMWKPMMETNFKSKLSSLANYIIDNY